VRPLLVAAACILGAAACGGPTDHSAGDLATPAPDLAGNDPPDLHRSVDGDEDGGAGAWSLVGAVTGTPTSLAISPDTGATPFNLFVATSGAGVFHSSDGANWASGGPASVVALGSFPMANVCWASLSDGTAQLTTNSGASWGPTATAPPIAIDAWAVVAGVGPFGGGASGGKAVVVNGKAMGATWTSSQPFGTGAVRALAYGGLEAGKAVLFAAVSGAGGGVFRSTDGGTAFAATTFPESDALAVATAQTSLSTVLAGTNGQGAGVYRSTDSGATWSAGGAGLASTTVHAIAIDPTHANLVYVGTEAGVYRSSDGGATFQHAGLTTRAVEALAIQNGAPSTIFAVTPQGLYVTTSGGL
jgi:hypothetical protein